MADLDTIVENLAQTDLSDTERSKVRSLRSGAILPGMGDGCKCLPVLDSVKPYGRKMVIYKVSGKEVLQSRRSRFYSPGQWQTAVKERRSRWDTSVCGKLVDSVRKFKVQEIPAAAGSVASTIASSDTCMSGGKCQGWLNNFLKIGPCGPELIWYFGI